ncbi:hypothetical protein BN946_scf185003.g20 [Trametes cinnabarina]|uniref:HAT C-terminal dimerisation domain-containing protein n=1 Tax=Pycnoporus cinnabarinus TaxID=5643 RepID=A0A060S6Y2_PYCCI|nr:hypothetical protein BN946_scf185003.g20 [Trametes cinnabarina]
MELERLFVQLWKRLFRVESDSDIPLDLYVDMSDYFHKKGWFENIDDYVNTKLERARMLNIPVDPLEIWDGISIVDRGPRPLAMLARRILSVCANSASCERLFSIFGQLLTKLRNRMGSTTLSALAELKMHLRDEYSRSQGMKERLKRHCGKPQEDTVTAEARTAAIGTVDNSTGTSAATTVPRPSESSTQPANESEAPLAGGSPSTTSPGELRAISDALARARDEDTDADSHRISAQYTFANGRSRPFSRTLSELFNFDAPQWITRIEAFASLGLDQELALYELLDLDAAGESVVDGSEHDGAGDLSDLDVLSAEILHA